MCVFIKILASIIKKAQGFLFLKHKCFFGKSVQSYCFFLEYANFFVLFFVFVT